MQTFFRQSYHVKKTIRYASNNEFAAKSIKQWNLNVLLVSPLKKTSLTWQDIIIN